MKKIYEKKKSEKENENDKNKEKKRKKKERKRKIVFYIATITKLIIVKLPTVNCTNMQFLIYLLLSVNHPETVGKMCFSLLCLPLFTFLLSTE